MLRTTVRRAEALAFQRDGFVRLRDAALRPELIAPLRERFERLFRGHFETGHPTHTHTHKTPTHNNKKQPPQSFASLATCLSSHRLPLCPQRSALQNSALQNSALQSSALQYSALPSAALQNSALQNSALQSAALLSCALPKLRSAKSRSAKSRSAKSALSLVTAPCIYTAGVYPDEWHWREGISRHDAPREICNGWKVQKHSRLFRHESHCFPPFICITPLVRSVTKGRFKSSHPHATLVTRLFFPAFYFALSSRIRLLRIHHSMCFCFLPRPTRLPPPVGSADRKRRIERITRRARMQGTRLSHYFL